MDAKNQTMVSVEGHTLLISNIDKVFWPQHGYTKADILQYYTSVWPYLAPHLHNRLLSLVRYPHGINGHYFYQKNFPDAPFWVERVPLRAENRVTVYCMANNLATLLWSVNLGCIEVHPWLSRFPHLENPTYIIIDLDPMEPATFSDAVEVALAIKILLDQINLRSFPKISGATGLHIYIPIAPIYTFKQTSQLVESLGDIIIRTMPDKATNQRAIKDRGGRVYIDHLQNLKGKTIAAVYSLRPFPEAPVSMPVRWEELRHVSPGSFTIKNALDRIKKEGDLFAPLLNLDQSLNDALRLLGVTDGRRH